MLKSELKEIIRLSYLAGIEDQYYGHFEMWDKGSTERAEWWMEEFEEEGLLTSFTESIDKENTSRKVFEYNEEVFDAYKDKLHSMTQEEKESYIKRYLPSIEDL